jgi:hypothetical protein
VPKPKINKLSSSRELSTQKSKIPVKKSKVDTSQKVLPKSVKQEVKTFFGSESKKIMELLTVGDQDSGISLLKKTLLLTVIRALPASERVLAESNNSRGVYQFNQIVSQIRELITDIQADRDRAYIAQSLIETIIRPAMMDIAQNVLSKHHEFRKATEDYIIPKQQQTFSTSLIAMAKDLAGDMNVAYKDISAKLIEALKT